MKVVYSGLIPFRGFVAVNLFGVVFVRRGHVASARLLRHEGVHSVQMRELLWVGFYLWYVMEWLVRLVVCRRRAYMGIGFEVEARLGADDEGYLHKRRPYAWARYMFNDINIH